MHHRLSRLLFIFRSHAGARIFEWHIKASVCALSFYELDASDAEMVGTGVGNDGGDPQFPTL
jgi:hypothetical protein